MDLDRLNELGFEKTPKWHSVVLVVAYNKWWKIFMAAQCLFAFLLCTYFFGHRWAVSKLLVVRYLIDLCYIFEIVCVVIYRMNRRIRKLKYVKTRGWIFIFIDILSVIPLDVIYYCHCSWGNPDRFLQALFVQNRSLRMYRLFLMEYTYETITRKPFQYILLSVFQYTIRLILVAHVLATVWVLVDKSVRCPSQDEFNCSVWYEHNFVDLVLLNWSGRIDTFRKPWERVLATIGILSGFFIVFYSFYPKIFYYGMQLSYKRALYYEQLGKLELFFKNMALKPKLKTKILNHFNDTWSRERADPNLMSLLMNIPLGMRKEISADIYWESLRHSELFREVSRNCKRSLSLLMTTEYYHPDEVIFYKGQEKLKMIFITQGILQIMAEENKDSPLLSFSGGTVFGELSLFFYLQSRAILKCRAYCELQILTMRAAASVLRAYPKDKKLVLRNLHERLSMAKFTQWRKQKLKEELKKDVLSIENSSTEDCVNWLKNQWRSIWEAHKRHQEVIRAKNEGRRLQSWRALIKTELKFNFVSNYLDLLVLSDLFEEKKDVFCLRTTFPWSIYPSTQFLTIWYYVVLMTSLIPILGYPVCTAWLERFPLPVYHISYVVTLIFMIDVFLKLFTAIETKHSVITQFSAVLRHLLQKPTFYFDVIAALPYQVFVFYLVDVSKAKAYEVGLYLHPALLKAYVLLTVKVPLGDCVEVMTVLKNWLIFTLCLFWASELLQLVAVRNALGIGRSVAYRFRNLAKDNAMTNYYLSVFSSMVATMSIPDLAMYPRVPTVQMFFSFAKYLFFLLLSWFLTEFYGVATVKIYRSETFQVLVKRISNFLENIYISEEITERLLHTLRFQWEYDKADYLSSKMTIINSIPLNLRKQVYAATICKTLQMCPVFQDESLDLVMEMAEKSFLVAVPRGSVLVTYGHTSQFLIILHRGYAQMNSYLTKDVSAEVGGAIQIGPGYIFPLLSTLCSIPSSLSVVTVTDCEVIMMQLDDVLSVMFRHNFFKDLTETLTELDLQKRLLDTKPGLLKMSAPILETGKDVFKTAFEQRGFFWKCMYAICPKKKGPLNMKFFKYWDVAYIIYLTTMCWLWPCCFGLFLTYSHILVPILTGLKVFEILNLLIRFQLPYYNKKGLLVTHPVYTSLNYIGHSFLLDLIRTFPVYTIYLYCCANPWEKPHIALIMVVFVQLFLKMFYVIQFLDNLEHIFRNRYFIRILKVTLWFGFVFHFFLNLMVFLYTNWIYGGAYQVVGLEPQPGRFPENSALLDENSPWDYYVLMAHWALCALTTNEYLLHKCVGNQLYLMYILGFFGTFIGYFFYVWVASNSIFANIRGTIYQEKVFSLINYLKYERTDDELIEYASSYYNYEWSQTHGESLRKLCEHLPTHLYDEIVYPIYRPTFNKNKIFAEADEGFFKALATNVKSVFFNRGSVIMFKKEVQSNIYFVHKGKCFVFDWFLVLDNGSIVGDIQRTGLMQNKVYALTHVEMLKITSDLFFNILNCFYVLEANFLYVVKNAENFLVSDVLRTGQQLRPVDSKDVLKAFCLKTKEMGSEDESFFEDPKNSTIIVLKNVKFSNKAKFRFLVIYPGTWKMKAYTALNFAVIIATLFCLPVFTSFGGLTTTAFTIIGVTDFLWLVVIILTFLVGITDNQKGDVITDFRLIAKNYAMRVNGLTLDVLALIPFEMIPVALAKGVKGTNGHYVAWGRIFRYLRGRGFYKFLKSEAESLDNNILLKQFYMIALFIVILLVTASVYAVIATEPSIVAARNHYILTKDQFFAFVTAFEYVINFVSSANLCVAIPNTKNQVFFFNFYCVLYIYFKCLLISKVLSLLHVKGVATAYYKSQILELESYLLEKDTSPSIIKEVLTYKTNLLLLSRSENMPSLLRSAPATIRIMIMRDIYIQHLINCPLFENLDKVFLDQLIARAAREFYFPGQKIVEQGDVDSRMYFIHKGEVYIISQTKDKAYIEVIVRIIDAGQSFGEAQGLWFSVPHPYTYRARTLVEMLVIHSDDWVDLRRSFPEDTKKIFEKAKALRYI